MKQIFLCLCAFFGGCDQSVTDDQILSSMVSPVILIGKNVDKGNYANIVSVAVMDSTGEIRTFYNNKIAYALSSRQVGDTIK